MESTPSFVMWEMRAPRGANNLGNGADFFGNGIAMPQLLESDVRTRLAEAEDARRAIRDGEVDALLVDAPDGVQIRSLVDRTWPRRLVRITIGGMLIAAAVWFTAGSILYRTSVHATITAPLAAVRIPTEGLVYGAPPMVGEKVSAGEQLFEVQPASADARPLERLRAESASLGRTINALAAQIKELDAIEGSLKAHFGEYRKLRVEHARRLTAEHDALVDSAASRLKSAELELYSQKLLHQKGSVSPLDLAKSEHASQRARHELEAARQGELVPKYSSTPPRKGFSLEKATAGRIWWLLVNDATRSRFSKRRSGPDWANWKPDATS